MSEGDGFSRVRKAIKANNLCQHLGFEFTSIEKGQTEAQLLVSQQLRQQSGLVHGGVLSTFADVLCGFAAYTLVDELRYPVTANLAVNYLRGARSEQIFGKGWVVKEGQTLHYCEAEIFERSDSGQIILLTKATATMAMVSAE